MIVDISWEARVQPTIGAAPGGFDGHSCNLVLHSEHIYVCCTVYNTWYSHANITWYIADIWASHRHKEVLTDTEMPSRHQNQQKPYVNPGAITAELLQIQPY